MKFTAFVIVFLLTISALNAELKFESARITVDAKVGEARKSGVFAFVNEGDEPVTITRIKSSCGCTTTALDKMTYAPGESGQIEATLDIGSRKGEQNKYVTIWSKPVGNPDAEESPQRIMLTVNIPETLKLSNSMLVWRNTEPLAEKAITVQNLYPDPIHIKKIEIENEFFETRVETIEEGRQYRIMAKPLTRDFNQTVPIRVVSDFPADAPQTFHAYLRVLRPKRSSASASMTTSSAKPQARQQQARPPAPVEPLWLQTWERANDKADKGDAQRKTEQR